MHFLTRFMRFIHPDLTTFLFKTEASRRLRDGCCCASQGSIEMSVIQLN
jgi:hypothetical protein